MYYPYTACSLRTINGPFRKASREDFAHYNRAVALLHRWTNPHCGGIKYRTLNASFLN
jgi:hypothetical protein